MQLAKVRGSVTATVKHAVYDKEKLLLLQALDANQRPKGKAFVAIDRIQAGAGDIVLYLDEGNSARMVLENSAAPARAVAIAIVDRIDLE